MASSENRTVLLQQKIRVLVLCRQAAFALLGEKMSLIHESPVQKEGCRKEDDPLTRKVIGAAIEVHQRLDPGLLESTYETCFCYELELSGLQLQRQIRIPVIDRDVKLDSGYRIDILVENEVVIEVKSVATLLPVHEAQLLT
jgi:GxxExxY protein